MKLRTWSLLLVVALVVAACVVPVSTPAEPPAEPAVEEPDAAPTPTPEVKEPVKLTYWHIGGLLSEIEVAKDETEKWNASHPDIQVEFVEVPWEGAAQKMITSWEAEALADVIAYPSPGIGEFGPMGMYVDLEKTFPEGVAEIAGRIPPEALATGRPAGTGPLYGIPYGVDLSMLAYNVDRFEEAGLDPDKPPKTYSELLDAAEKLATEDMDGFTFEGKAQSAPNEFIRYYLPAMGGRMVSEDGKTITFNDDAGVKALEYIVSLVEAGVTPDNLLDLIYMDNSRLFFAGKVGMYRGATWTPGLAEDLGFTGDFEYRLSSFPSADPEWIVGSREPCRSEITSFAVPAVASTSEHPEEAWEFVKWLTRDESLNRWITDVRARMPIAISGLTSDEAKQLMPGIYASYQDGTLFEGTCQPESFPGLTEINQVLMAEIQQALVGKKTPKQALDDAAVEAQKILDEIGEEQ
jgi:ABC-type glycerol-3-phosphate transport system substrate-binding protein